MNNTILDRIISDIENKNYSSVISECSKLIEQYPDNIKLYEIRSVCYSATGNYDSSIEDLSVIIPKLTDSNDDYLMSLYARRGKNYIKKGEWISAVRDLIKAIKINGSIPELHNNLAACLRRINRFEDAFIHASKAIELNSNFPEAFNNRANINICLEKYEEAVSDYSESINLNPANPNTYFNRGSIYYEVFDDVEKARDDFITAVKLNPGYEQDICKEYPEFKELLFESSEYINEHVEENMYEENEEEVCVDNVVEDEKVDKEEIDDKVETDSKDEIEDLISKLDENNQTDKVSDPLVKPENEEIVVPEFDLKSIFGNQEQADDIQPVEEENQTEFKPVLSDDVKSLHDEILSVPEFKTNEPETIQEERVKKPAPYIPTARKTDENKKSFLKSPLFYLIVIILFVAILIPLVIKINYTDEKNNVATITKQEDVEREIKDEPKEEVKEETKAEENKVPKQEVKEEPKNEEIKQPVLESKNLGFIGNKQKFVLFSEQDGYYVQIGSFKEKSKAEDKLKLLNKNNIKGAIVETDLKEKGIFYRVRAGAFQSEDEAKQVTLKLE